MKHPCTNCGKEFDCGFGAHLHRKPTDPGYEAITDAVFCCDDCHLTWFDNWRLEQDSGRGVSRGRKDKLH